MRCLISSFFFFFNDTATTEIYTLSLHDALPISRRPGDSTGRCPRGAPRPGARSAALAGAARHWRPTCPSLAQASRRRSEEHTSELQSHSDLVCRLLLEKKKRDYVLMLILACHHR